MMAALCIFTVRQNGTIEQLINTSVVDVIKPLRCYDIRLTPYAASGSVKLTRVLTTLDGFLRP